jgi:glucose-1-phosphate adenylyltransferase
MITTNELAKEAVAVVLAGGKGTRLGALTRHVCKPALPFGAAYRRNIDFSLSNCVNSGISRIGVATQHNPELLLRHIDEVWRGVLKGPREFISAWTAEERAPAHGYRGTADAVFRNLDVIERMGSRFVLVLAGDHVYQMDYRPMLARHRERRADVTVGCVEVEVDEASQFGILSVDRHGRIDRFVEKPQTRAELPGGDRVMASMGIYVFDTDFLSDVLRRDAFSSQSRHDFGGDILPSLIRDARVFAHPFGDCGGNRRAYWRDVGTPAAYWRAHLELLDSTPSLRLDDAHWPLPAARGVPKLTARHARSGHDGSDGRSLVADDCVVGGTVRRSVLFSGVKVSQGALVENAVILPGAVIGRDCRLRGVIVDSECRIPDGTVIDHTWGGRASYETLEPVVVTAEDFSSELVSSCA